eukprot:NODE_3610_length_753_cov_72.731534_g3028_i0.p1 GENE.NODE_3610_length_753_cov_72.731534_g3028_i0~~NODE_3610_length_753_cov_72.731534_g3028_i0.p1  ORF type:complete len:174 (-),score=79.20 NODE_3610_length_753_cov_72.731534_g3028_i0:232-729(-)
MGEEKEAGVAGMHGKLKQTENMFLKEDKKFEDYKKKMEQQNSVEEELREQLHLYSGKFEQFQQTLQKSNPVFQSYKREMDEMSTRIRNLEHENAHLRLKCHKTDVQIVEADEEEAKSKKRMAILEPQNKRLHQLCKTLTTERATYREKLSNHKKAKEEEGAQSES